MSVNYDKYSRMPEEQLQKAIDDRKVTPEYLAWLGVTEKGRVLRELIKKEPRS